MVITTNGTYPKISRNGYSSDGGHRISFEVMASTKPIGSIGSIALSSAVTLYQGNHDSILCQHVEQKMFTLSEHLSSPPGLQWSSCSSIFNFLGNVLQVIVFPSVVFLVVVVLSVLRFTAFDYPFGGIFKLSILYIQYFILSNLHIDAFKPVTFYCSTILKFILIYMGW